MAHPLAGKHPTPDMLIDVDKLVAAYYDLAPDPDDPAQQVAFGTSGHRGSSLTASFNEAHILAIAQAVYDYRFGRGFDGPLYLGADTHALSGPALRTAVEVLAANGAAVQLQPNLAPVPTPLVSRAIIAFNAGRTAGLADGVVVTPSHNPPQDGGFKYNPPHGGPADKDVTTWIEERAAQYLAEGNRRVKRMDYNQALTEGRVHWFDFVDPYVVALRRVLDMPAIQGSGLKLGVDPLGGSSIGTWQRVAEFYGLDLTVVNTTVDPTFGFMTVDKDGVIRMDCSSPYAMAGLLQHKDSFDLAFGNDPDADRHGVITREGGLMNPNNYLAVSVDYLFARREGWPADAKVGKTLVSSAMIDRVAKALGRDICEVPVGFKWFVEGLLSGEFGFGGEESAGGSFLMADGKAWTTDKDGVLMCLLAAEITAKTGQNPHARYEALATRFGRPIYERIQAPADRRQKEVLSTLAPEDVTSTTLAGEPIERILTRAPGNHQPIGGLKVVTENGWFAARPSGTEEIYKIYVESFKGRDHLEALKQEAQDVVSQAFAAAGV